MDPNSDNSGDITTALPGFLPEIRGKTRIGWLLIAMIVVAGLTTSVLVWGKGDKPWQVQFIIAFAVVGLGIVTASWVQRQHAALIMPFLARSAGLTFTPTAKPFLAALPQRLLPKAAIRKGEDLLAGKIGDRHVEMAEVKYETGGKGSTVLFQGIVLAFPNVAPMLPFFVAPEAETRKRFLAGAHIRVDDLVQIGSRMNGGVSYGVWASSSAIGDHPALEAVLRILVDLQTAVGGDAKLFSATSNGEVMHVAISHKRDLFTMGGLFADQTMLMDDIKSAYADLTLPMAIAAKLLEAERATLA